MTKYYCDFCQVEIKRGTSNYFYIGSVAKTLTGNMSRHADGKLYHDACDNCRQKVLTYVDSLKSGGIKENEDDK